MGVGLTVGLGLGLRLLVGLEDGLGTIRLVGLIVGRLLGFGLVGLGVGRFVGLGTIRFVGRGVDVVLSTTAAMYSSIASMPSLFWEPWD